MIVFFFNVTLTSKIYTLSLHDALPISAFHRAPDRKARGQAFRGPRKFLPGPLSLFSFSLDRKSTRLNSSHTVISYAVFCLKKKNIHNQTLYLSDRICNTQ